MPVRSPEAMPTTRSKAAVAPDMSLYGGADTTAPPSPSFSPLPTPSAGLSDASGFSASSTEPETDASSVDGREPLSAAAAAALRQRKDVGGESTAATAEEDEHLKLYGLDRTDFLWTMTEEPHRSRRLAILKAHPEIKSLMGHTRTTKYLVALVVGVQLSAAILFAVHGVDPLSWRFLLTAYALGGTCNQNLFLAIHEISHNMAFKSITANRLLAMTANLGIGVPYSVVFKKYHLEHHKRMGEDGVDTDIPCKFEAMFLNNVAGKTFFAIFQIFFYALRPTFVRSAGAFTRWHALNFIMVLGLDALLTRTFGWTPVLYLLFSSFFAGSLHPLAGHFIAEHYVFQEGEDQETYSYYGWLNVFAYNVGFHNEHHDFPNVPWTKLAQVTALAPEFYGADALKSHASWPMVTWRFITDPTVGMFSRVKRVNERGD